MFIVASHLNRAGQGTCPFICCIYILLFAVFLDQATPVEYLCIYLVFDVVFAIISFGKHLL